jgi:ABC-2 type transport system permease protein
MTWPLVRKDMLLWLRVPQSIMVTLLIPIIIMTVAMLADTVQQQLSVAVVDESGSAEVITNEIEASPYFNPLPATGHEAEAWLHQDGIVAVISIPADYSESVAAREPVIIEMNIRNRDEDLTRNMIMRLYYIVFKANQRLLADIPDVGSHLIIRERPLLPETISDALYLATGLLVFTALYGGLANTALLTAREWDELAIKEVLLAPRPYYEFVFAKILAGWLETVISIIAVFFFAFLVIELRPAGNLWLIAGFLLLTSLFGAAIGALFGCAIRRIIPAVMLSILISVISWFIGGGFGPVMFTGEAAQQIAWMLPPTYAIAALQQLMHTSRLAGLDYYALIIGFSTVIAILISLFACNQLLLRRPLGQGKE